MSRLINWITCYSATYFDTCLLSTWFKNETSNKQRTIPKWSGWTLLIVDNLTVSTIPTSKYPKLKKISKKKKRRVTLKFSKFNLDETGQVNFIEYVKLSKIVKLATVVKGESKAPFSVATRTRCRGGRHSFPRIAPLYPWYVPYNAEC